MYAYSSLKQHCCNLCLSHGPMGQWRQSGLKSGGSWIRVKKSIFPGKFPKISIFSGNFTQKIRFFQDKFSSFTATSGQIILFLFESHHFRTNFLYIISYNNISRPVHDPPTTPCNPLPPAQNLGDRDL